MRGTGRVIFAATLLLIVGTLNIVYGIGALDNANIFANDTRYILTDLNTLGWVLIILGVIQLAGGFSLMAGNTYGRVIGIIGGTLGAIGALLSIGGTTHGGRSPSSPCACMSSTASSSSARTRGRREPEPGRNPTPAGWRCPGRAASGRDRRRVDRAFGVAEGEGHGPRCDRLGATDVAGDRRTDLDEMFWGS